jgi:hypothetical protein
MFSTEVFMITLSVIILSVITQSVMAPLGNLLVALIKIENDSILFQL